LNYTYTLNGVEVNPDGKWEIEYHRNEGQIFWRRILRGELIFKGDDYDYINSIIEDLVSVSGGCTILSFVIYCNGVELWTGQFKYPYDFTFDEDSCEVIGTPEVVDAYTCIMTNYNTEYRPSAINPDLFPHVSIPVKECGGGIPATLVDLDECDSLYDHIYNILNNNDLLDCSYAIRSSFLFLDEFPGYAPGHYAGVYGTDNYVTSNFNYLDQIYLILNYYVRISLLGTACTDWYEWKITFQFYESLLRDRFNAYWYIDSDGYFRIEHISYFLSAFPYSDFGPQADLTTLMSGCHSFAERRNKYKHQTDKLFDQERWEWQHYFGEEGGVTHGDDFQGVPIYYGADFGKKSDCVFGEFKEKVTTTTDLWTDIPWALALADPDEIDCSGYLMLVRVDIPITGWQVLCSAGIYSNLVGQNVFLSTANLMHNFFTWDRIFLEGVMNGGGFIETLVFDSAIKKKLQDEIEYTNCCDEFDPMKTVTTEMGDGTVHSAVQTPYSVKIQLLYD
jgi:hypothetical protein